MRPPPQIDFDFDLAHITDKIMGGVVPTLYYHLSMGFAQPGLIQSMGMGEIEVGVFLLVLVGQRDIKSLVLIR